MPVCREFKPHPTTLQEKRQAKEDAVSRLNRIKAKAVKSVTKSLVGVDESNLLYAVGLSSEAQQSSRPSKKMTDISNMDDPDDVQFIADALGLPIEMFGVMPPKQLSVQSLNGEELCIVSGVKDVCNVPFEGSLTSGEVHLPPRAGSLAAALGILVNNSPKQTVLESNSDDVGQEQSGQAPAPMGPSGIDDMPDNPLPVEEPHLGTLAHALGIPGSSLVSQSSSILSRSTDQAQHEPLAHMLQVDASTSVAQRVWIQSGLAHPGSLAAALGISVDDSVDAPAVRSTRSIQVFQVTPFKEVHIESGTAHDWNVVGGMAPPSVVDMQSSRDEEPHQDTGVVGIPADPFALTTCAKETHIDYNSTSSTESDESEEDFYLQAPLSDLDNVSDLDAGGTAARSSLAERRPRGQTLMGAVFGNVIANVQKSSTANLKSVASHQKIC